MKYPKLTFAAQGIAAMILFMASGMKFFGDPNSIDIFTKLGMEPTGRYVIAIIELLAAMLLLSPFAALGSIIAVAVMCGAIIAHVTQLSIIVNDDGGTLFCLLTVVFLCSTFVLISRRKDILFIGRSF